MVLDLASLVGDTDNKQINKSTSANDKCYGEKQSGVRVIGSAGWGDLFSRWLALSIVYYK